MMLQTGQNFRTLHIEGMARTFGDFKALNGVSLDIQRGEFVAVGLWQVDGAELHRGAVAHDRWHHSAR